DRCALPSPGSNRVAWLSSPRAVATSIVRRKDEPPKGGTTNQWSVVPPSGSLRFDSSILDSSPHRHAATVLRIVMPVEELAVEGVHLDFPHAPDALALVVTLVEDVVLTEVVLAPVTGAVLNVVSATHGEAADPVATLAAELAVAKREVHLHHVPARNRSLQEV